jgi:pentatricopeptide repeat protein
MPCWHSVIAGLVQQGRNLEAVECFLQMQAQGQSLPCIPTLRYVLKACASTGWIEAGQKIHDELAASGALLQIDVAINTALMDMYGKCHMVAKAQQVHDGLLVRDVISWSALIAAHAQHGQGHEALDCFFRMQAESLAPNGVTYISIMKACGSIGAIEKGEAIHNQVISRGLPEVDVVLGTALVDMYAKCGALAQAQQVHDDLCVRDVVSWSALIAGYVQHGYGDRALDCFRWMWAEGITANVGTFVCVLKACGLIRDIDKGKSVHDEIICRGLLREKHAALGVALVDMYAKCGNLAEAHQILESLPARNAVSWNALIAGYVRQGRCHCALNCFDRMQGEHLSPDAVTFTCILNACGSTGAIDKGKQIHEEISSRNMLDDDIVLGNALIDMYAKCGALAKAQEVLEDLPLRNTISWSTLISGYAQHGQVCEALKCFDHMQGEGLYPDSIMLMSVLNACSHSGLLEEAEMHLRNMNAKYGLPPEVEHHTCLVSLLGCAGHLDKAVSVIKGIPSSTYTPIWLTLLCACRKWGNIKLGRLTFDQAIQLDDTCGAAYVLMAAIYTDAGMIEEAEKVEAMRPKSIKGRKLLPI